MDLIEQCYSYLFWGAHLLRFLRQLQIAGQILLPGPVLELRQHMAGQGRGIPLDHQHQHQLPQHGPEAYRHHDAQQHQPQRQRVGDGGGVEPVQGIVKAEQTQQRRKQGEKPPHHAQGGHAKADPFTDHGTPPPFSADCADRD